MKLSEYLKQHAGISVSTLAAFTGLNRSTLSRKYNRSPALIDELLERYSDSITVSGTYEGSNIGGGTLTRSKRVRIEQDKWSPVK